MVQCVHSVTPWQWRNFFISAIFRHFVGQRGNDPTSLRSDSHLSSSPLQYRDWPVKFALASTARRPRQPRRRPTEKMTRPRLL